MGDQVFAFPSGKEAPFDSRRHNGSHGMAWHGKLRINAHNNNNVILIWFYRFIE